MSNPNLLATSWSGLGSNLVKVVEALASPLAILTTDLEYFAVNPAYLAVTDRTADDLLGRHLFDVFPENPESLDGDRSRSLRRSLRSVIETRAADSMPLIRYDVLDSGGQYRPRYWHVTNVPIFDDDGEVEFILNNPEEVTTFIDERLRLEAEGRTTGGHTPSQTRALGEVFTSAVSRLQSLNDLASALVGASNPGEVGQAVMRDGLAMVGATAGSLALADGERLEIVGSVGIAAGTAADWQGFTIEPGQDPFSDVIAVEEPLFFPDRAAFLDRYPHLANAVEASGHQAWAVLPLRTDDDIAGAIGVIFDAPNEFDTPTRLVLYALANLTAQAASRARLLVDQALALRSIETAFHPRLDAIEGIRVSHLYRAATVAAGAGGDWYDLISVGDTSLIVIGDVANHGAVAVGEMVRARATVHALAHLGMGPAEIASTASSVLSKLASTFSTCVIALFDHDTSDLRWTTAGHPYPILVSADGTIDTLTPTSGPPLGAGIDHPYQEHHRHLAPGDTLVLYTDGLIERVSRTLDDGFDALRDALRRLNLTAPDLADRLFDELHQADRRRDDVAILTIRILDDTDSPDRPTIA